MIPVGAHGRAPLRRCVCIAPLRQYASRAPLCRYV